MTRSVLGAPLRLGVVFLTVGVLKATQLHVKIMGKHLELNIPFGGKSEEHARSCLYFGYLHCTMTGVCTVTIDDNTITVLVSCNHVL